MADLNRRLDPVRPKILAVMQAIQVAPGHEEDWNKVLAQLPALVANLHLVYRTGDIVLEPKVPQFDDLWLRMTRGTSWHGSVDPYDLADLAVD